MNQKKILVVEDNSDLRELLVLVLGRLGYEIVEAATGVEAIERTHATHPDLILMDLGLPNLTGDEATVRLKADPYTRDIPVIVTTAFLNGTLVERVATAGAAQIMYKPVDLSALRGMVNRYLISDCEP
jgi:CheY-like chemotaxis protein